MPPAILKGWIDRVMRAGVAYQFVECDQGEGIPIGILKADNVLILTHQTQQPKGKIKCLEIHLN